MRLRMMKFARHRAPLRCLTNKDQFNRRSCAETRIKDAVIVRQLFAFGNVARGHVITLDHAIGMNTRGIWVVRMVPSIGLCPRRVLTISMGVASPGVAARGQSVIGRRLSEVDALSPGE